MVEEFFHQNEKLVTFFVDHPEKTWTKETLSRYLYLRNEFEILKELEFTQKKAIEPILVSSFVNQVEKLQQLLELTRHHSLSLISNEKNLFVFTCHAGNELKRNKSYWISFLKITYILMFFFQLSPKEISVLSFNEAEALLNQLEKKHWKNLVKDCFSMLHKEQKKSKKTNKILFFSVDTFHRILSKDIQVTANMFLKNQKVSWKSFFQKPSPKNHLPAPTIAEGEKTHG